MVDDVSRRGVLLSAGAALSGGIATKYGTTAAAAKRDGGRDDVPPVRWHEAVANDGDDLTRPTGIRASGGRLAVGGFSGDEYDTADPWSVSVDAVDGSARSDLTLDVDGRFLTQGSAPIGDGDRVFLGRYTAEPDAEDATRLPTLVRAGGDGEAAWRRTYEPPFDYFRVTDLTPDASGGAVFVGHSTDIDNPNTWLVAVGADGSVRWERTLDEFFATYGIGVEQTDDEGFLVYGGARRGEQWDIDRQDGWVAKVGPDGDRQWSRRYAQRSAGEESEYHYLADAVETDDGYLFAGYVSTDADDSGRAWAISTDSAGGRLYSTLAQPGSNGDGEFVAAVPSDDGHLLVGSGPTTADGDVEVSWIRSVDASLSTNWDALDPLGRPTVVHDAVATSDGGVALTGNHDSDDGWADPFVAKLGGDPVETATPTPTATTTPSRTPTATLTPTATATRTPTATDANTRAPASKTGETDESAPESNQNTTTGDGPGFGVGAALAALGGGALLTGRSNDGE
ncbi:PGF-CTERM sorting domain-containing protein [Halosimplex salinum]|uniref:PGF-CTERM sorting domain-containing protein n=1 Tax=Halosimplex salinum TaxID=1710538 RepID=UPI000F4A386A|nr:PGF-CTERM sorting domain-containing protein [Halosimplex salinum]